VSIEIGKGVSRTRYSAVRTDEGGRCSGHSAMTARATMIPTETSMNLCKAIAHGAAERGIRTMIVSVMLAQRYAVFSKRNANDSNPTRKKATAYAIRFV
jgi:hypothetical protein